MTGVSLMIWNGSQTGLPVEKKCFQIHGNARNWYIFGKISSYFPTGKISNETVALEFSSYWLAYEIGFANTWPDFTEGRTMHNAEDENLLRKTVILVEITVIFVDIWVDVVKITVWWRFGINWRSFWWKNFKSFNHSGWQSYYNRIHNLYLPSQSQKLF